MKLATWSLFTIHLRIVLQEQPASQTKLKVAVIKTTFSVIVWQQVIKMVINRKIYCCMDSVHLLATELSSAASLLMFLDIRGEASAVWSAELACTWGRSTNIYCITTGGAVGGTIVGEIHFSIINCIHVIFSPEGIKLQSLKIWCKWIKIHTDKLWEKIKYVYKKYLCMKS